MWEAVRGNGEHIMSANKVLTLRPRDRVVRARRAFTTFATCLLDYLLPLLNLLHYITSYS